jgi:1-acyl-sn-glycerol-3-phosphate acyltransferase
MLTRPTSAPIVRSPDVIEPAGAPSRRPRARVSPEALARAHGDAREGLDWLGRPPEVRARPFYRLVRVVVRAILFGLFRFRIETSGQERLPRGGYLLIAAAHRGWMDPFVVLHAIPAEPRAWFLGSAASTFTAPWREWLVRRVGGLLPVWRGGIGVDAHVASAQAVVERGGVFVQMPEGTVSGPVGRIGPFRSGAALIALRTGAPIVPLAMAGTDELYIGKGMASRVLPPTTARDLLAGDWNGVPPPVGSRAELELARALTDRFANVLGPEVEALWPATIDPPGHRKLLRRRLTWLLLAPGPLDRN